MGNTLTMYDVLWEPDPLWAWSACAFFVGSGGLCLLATVLREVWRWWRLPTKRQDIGSGGSGVVAEPIPIHVPIAYSFTRRSLSAVGCVVFLIGVIALLRQVVITALGWWEFPAGCGTMMALAGWLIGSWVLWRELPQAEQDELARGPDGRGPFTWLDWMTPRAVALSLMGLIGCLALSGAMGGRAKVRQCQDWATNQEYETLEGTISKFVHDKNNARFEISGRIFRFRNDFPPGILAGGDLRYGRILSWSLAPAYPDVGQVVRVHHHNGIILRIELAIPRGGNAKGKALARGG